jgi:hypothetical protein
MENLFITIRAFWEGNKEIAVLLMKNVWVDGWIMHEVGC